LQYIKEHNLKANHNELVQVVYLFFLFAIYQRTQSESKSQPLSSQIFSTPLCLQYIKEHNLKANHNHQCVTLLSSSLFAIYQRTQSESKSQHTPALLLFPEICLQYIKEHNLKANHNSSSGVIVIG